MWQKEYSPSSRSRSQIHSRVWMPFKCSPASQPDVAWTQPSKISSLHPETHSERGFGANEKIPFTAYQGRRFDSFQRYILNLAQFASSSPPKCGSGVRCQERESRVPCHTAALNFSVTLFEGAGRHLQAGTRISYTCDGGGPCRYGMQRWRRCSAYADRATWRRCREAIDGNDFTV